MFIFDLKYLDFDPKYLEAEFFKLFASFYGKKYDCLRSRMLIFDLKWLNFEMKISKIPEGLTQSKNWYLFTPPNSECLYLEFKARCDILIWTNQRAFARYLETINALFRCDRWLITWLDHGLSDLWYHVASSRIPISQWSAAIYYQHWNWSNFTRFSGSKPEIRNFIKILDSVKSYFRLKSQNFLEKKPKSFLIKKACYVYVFTFS